MNPREGAKDKGRGRKSRDLGKRGEDAAARFLYQRGYDIVERNWTCDAGKPTSSHETRTTWCSSR